MLDEQQQSKIEVERGEQEMEERASKKIWIKERKK
jgi:hypothetical protein